MRTNFLTLKWIYIYLYYLKVPESCDFIGVIDLYFKIHKVFDLQYHTHVKTAMQFLERFIYEISIDDTLITSKMRDLALENGFN